MSARSHGYCFVISRMSASYCFAIDSLEYFLKTNSRPRFPSSGENQAAGVTGVQVGLASELTARGASTTEVHAGVRPHGNTIATP